MMGDTASCGGVCNPPDFVYSSGGSSAVGQTVAQLIPLAVLAAVDYPAASLRN